MEYGFGAGSENRTRTSFQKPDFESGASTSSATPAGIGCSGCIYKAAAVERR